MAVGKRMERAGEGGEIRGIVEKCGKDILIKKWGKKWGKEVVGVSGRGEERV